MANKKVKLRNGFVVNAVTPIVSGMEVVKIGGRGPYRFGSELEDIGVVGTVHSPAPPPEGRPSDYIAEVGWGGGKDWTEEYVESLVAYVDVQVAEQEFGPLTIEPKYHVDQVLFVKPNRHAETSYYPAVGSPYESDVKVTEVLNSRFGSKINYRVYVPSYGYMTLEETALITAKERERILHEDFKEYFVTTDLLPFFKKGERVKEYDGFIYNLEDTVIVEATKELKSNLSWSIKQ